MCEATRKSIAANLLGTIIRTPITRKNVPSLVADVDVFSAARTVVTLLFTGDMDYFLSLVFLVAGRRKVGSVRRVLTVPSDAR